MLYFTHFTFHLFLHPFIYFRDNCFQVLRVFKKLHRTRLKTFEGDEYALQGNIFCTLLIINILMDFAISTSNIIFYYILSCEG